jgi:uncharacterized protein (TIGR00251 family)
MLKTDLLRGKMTLIIEVKVSPGSGRSAWKIDKSGVLKVYLKSPPERGLANEELVKSLAYALKVPLKEVTIISGQTSRNKRIKINASITYEQFLAALGIEQQMTVF